MGILGNNARMPRTAQVADRVIAVDQTGSTNTLARELVASGKLAGAAGAVAGGSAASDRPYVAVVVADRQTAGRGRLDHTWESAPGESSTVSYVVTVPRALAVDETVNGWLQMTAGLATLDGIRDALVAVGAKPLRAAPADRLGLKWPNDIFVGDKKLGGILAELVPLPDTAESGTDASGGESSVETSDDAGRVAIIFGVGLNLAVPADRLPTPQATSLQLHYAPLPSGEELRDRIAAGTVAALRRRLAAFAAGPRDAAAALRRETAGVCVTLGRRAVAHFTDGSSLEGEAVALNDDASLTICDDAGATHVVRTADVGVLPA
ncbi:biotin--[acetyl-CoA-carboxylase] ligase [Bifidobacterium stellenboschense]|uniref:Biotin-(Acetyl-CoA carboxylase) ligase n=1 Tax=Bifidobacterium stellenboschense TaxID=762211 RepID=A0A087DP46_9BIFI|nr:biotin--[acetyl-CoA-carboxylase] ligase [Bifidobacterium stellenboschense]KFI97296.1 biotin-(acetyl-CoA carboxylase) ligase [Bifidobacterium stellenboschense]